MTTTTKIAIIALLSTLALGLDLVRAECPGTYCKTTEHRTTDSNALACGTDAAPCYGQTIETWAQQCSSGAPGKQCTLYSGMSSQTTKRGCVEGICVVTQVSSAIGASNRCVTTDCPDEPADLAPMDAAEL